MPTKKQIGEITHYFDHISVAVVKLSDKVKAGEKVLVEGHTTNFEQALDSMQVDHKPVKEAKKGESIGLKVADKVRAGDKVYRVSE
jgi:translation elongation factor EF-1alpha